MKNSFGFNGKIKVGLIILSMLVCFSCSDKNSKNQKMTAAEILGNPKYLAISYGGYRYKDHSIEPTLEELKEDMKILSAMGIKILRTYKVHLPHASNVLKAIRELKNEDPNFEMYVMLGAWINCEGAFNDAVKLNHNAEDVTFNTEEVNKAVALVNEYPDIVKILAIGNEAMVKWAATYYVQPKIILKWVNYCQNLKRTGKLPQDLWITSSDNFASWGGGDASYHTKDLEKLIKAVDYISMHSYPYHDTHYNPDFWKTPKKDQNKSSLEKVDAAMIRAQQFVENQYQSVYDYMKSLGVEKPIHIGETGWASISDGFYGPDGSHASDEYKEALFYHHMRDWSKSKGISCFYFQAFDEPWKDAQNPLGSENHFGLFTVDGQAKYVIWDLVEKGVFKGLKRGNKPIKKTYNGNFEALMQNVLPPKVPMD